MAAIHPTAIVEDGAVLGGGVIIGAYSIVGAAVELAAGVEIGSHVVIAGNTAIGEHSRVFPFASIGMPPQDLKFQGEHSRLRIGCKTIIREHVTINPGTKGGGMLTRVGDECLLMAGAHVAHDCTVGDHVILVNGATLGGHVEIGDWAIVGGLSAAHQFTRIGRHAMIGGMSGVENDVIPYGRVTGNRARLEGLNIVGLKRRQFTREQVHALRHAYQMLFGPDGTMAERLDRVAEQFGDVAPVMEMVDFMRSESSRGICQPAKLGINLGDAG